MAGGHSLSSFGGEGWGEEAPKELARLGFVLEQAVLCQSSDVVFKTAAAPRPSPPEEERGHPAAPAGFNVIQTAWPFSKGKGWLATAGKRGCLLLGLVAGLAGMAPGSASAQTNSAAAAQTANRYLVIVETSRSMQRRADGALQAVHDLLASGMNGQMRRGDSLGVWTFNDKLNTGQVPVQEWSMGMQKTITIRVLDFLKSQKYEKSVSYDKVLPVMDRVIKSSEFITVILISSGEAGFRGTPFDKQINESYKGWHTQQRAARMPFLTMLRAKGGKITDCLVTPAPWKLELPPLPAELLAQEVKKQEEAPAQKAPPAAPPMRMGAPLIVSGRKSETAQTPRPVEPVVTNSKVSVAATAPSQQAKEPAAPAAPAPPPKAETSPAVTQLKAEPVVTPTPTTGPVVSVKAPEPAAAPANSPEIARTPAQAPAAAKETVKREASEQRQAGSLSYEKKSQPSKKAATESAPVAVADLAEAGWSHKTTGIAVLCGLITVGAAWSWWARARARARALRHASLITQSLDRERRQS